MTAHAVTPDPRPKCAWCGARFEKGIGTFCSRRCMDEEVTMGSGSDLKSAFQVEQDRRKASEVMCTCGHREKAHGSHSGACLQKTGGRFDGASDQVRCRCKQFAAKVDETGDDASAMDLFQQLTLSMFAQYDERIKKLEKKVAYLEGAQQP